MTTINIPINIPDELVAQGAVELYARSKGWTPTLDRDHLDENGQVDGRETITNPQDAEDFCIAYVQGVVKADYQSLVVEQAKEQATAQFNALFAPVENITK